MSTTDHYDLVIVGGGIAGATVAKTVIEQAARQKTLWFYNQFSVVVQRLALY